MASKWWPCRSRAPGGSLVPDVRRAGSPNLSYLSCAESEARRHARLSLRLNIAFGLIEPPPLSMWCGGAPIDRRRVREATSGTVSHFVASRRTIRPGLAARAWRSQALGASSRRRRADVPARSRAGPFLAHQACAALHITPNRDQVLAARVSAGSDLQQPVPLRRAWLYRVKVGRARDSTQYADALAHQPVRHAVAHGALQRGQAHAADGRGAG